MTPQTSITNFSQTQSWAVQSWGDQKYRSYYSETSEQRTLWDQYKFKWISPGIEVVLFKRFQSHYIERGDKIWGFSFVHCGEVYNTLSLYRRVLFERFHCTPELGPVSLWSPKSSTFSGSQSIIVEPSRRPSINKSEQRELLDQNHEIEASKLRRYFKTCHRALEQSIH